MHVAEFTLHPKPGHFDQVAEIYSQFAAEFLSDHPALETVLILGDEAAGVVRGIGVFADRDSADAVNSDPEFASFNDAVAPLLAEASERVELNLLHLYTKYPTDRSREGEPHATNPYRRERGPAHRARRRPGRMRRRRGR